jgi:beta-mannanase
VWHDTWEMMLARIRDNYYRRTIRLTPQPVISLAMFPRTEFKQHARCAAGAFDNYYRQIAAALVEVGGGSAILRLGWEANVGSRSHPWGIDTRSEARGYIACFRRMAGVLRSVAPGFKFEWSNAKASAYPGNVMELYPGGDIVDVIGLHYYAIDDQFSTQEKWDAFKNTTRRGGPQGIEAWIRKAAELGKPFAVPEWGVWNRFTSFAVADTPSYMTNMYNFFRANAPRIAYENYSQCQESHRIGPRTLMPNASARYAELWRAGL